MSGTMTLETHAARVWHCRLRTFVTVFFFSVEKSMYFIHMLPASFLYNIHIDMYKIDMYKNDVGNKFVNCRMTKRRHRKAPFGSESKLLRRSGARA
jgi:hypothetical protein